MSRTAILSVRVVSDTKQAQRGAEETANAWSKFEKRLDKASVYAGVAGVALVGLGKKAVDSASRLEQSSGAVEAVFKKDSDVITKYAKDAWKNVGMSQAETQEMATILGAQLKNLGMPMKDVATETLKLSDLGADLAATYGGTTADAVSALSSLLRGERDPIEKYGVSINEAAVKAEALSLGLLGATQDAGKVAAAQGRAEVAQRKYNDAVAKYGEDSTQAISANATLTSANAGLEKAVAGTTTEMTAQQKAQATLSLLSKQTADAQGQAAREFDSVESATNRALAAWENTSAALGEALMPTVADLADHLAGLATWVADNDQLVRNLALGVGVAAGSILGLNAGIKTFKAGAAIFKGVTSAGQAAFGVVGRFAGGMRNANVAASTFSGVAGTLGGKVATLGRNIIAGAAASGKWVVQTTILTAKLVAQKTAQFAIATASKAAAAAQWLWNAAANANPLVLIITAIIAAIVLLILNWDTVKAVAVAVWDAITVAAKWLWETVLVPLGQFIATVFVMHWTVLKTVATAVWSAISAAGKWLWDNVLKPVGDWIAKTFVQKWTALKVGAIIAWNAVKAGGQALWNFIKQVAAWIAGGFVQNWNTLKSVASAVWNGIKSVGQGLWSWLKSIGSWISGTFATVWNNIKNTGVNAINAIIAPVQSLIGWLKDAGSWVSDLFAKGGKLLGKVFGFSAPEIPGLKLEAAPSVAGFTGGVLGTRSATPAVQQIVNVTVNAPNYVGDRNELARTIQSALKDLNLKQGRLATV